MRLREVVEADGVRQLQVEAVAERQDEHAAVGRGYKILFVDFGEAEVVTGIYGDVVPFVCQPDGKGEVYFPYIILENVCVEAIFGLQADFAGQSERRSTYQKNGNLDIVRLNA